MARLEDSDVHMCNPHTFLLQHHLLSICRRRHGRRDSLRDKRPMGILDQAMPARMVIYTELAKGQAPITSPVRLCNVPDM